MFIDARKVVWSLGLGAKEKLLLLAIAENCSVDGVAAFLPLDKLSAMLGSTDKTVKSHLKKLEQLGYVYVVSRRGANDSYILASLHTAESFTKTLVDYFGERALVPQKAQKFVDEAGTFVEKTAQKGPFRAENSLDEAVPVAEKTAQKGPVRAHFDNNIINTKNSSLSKEIKKLSLNNIVARPLCMKCYGSGVYQEKPCSCVGDTLSPNGNGVATGNQSLTGKDNGNGKLSEHRQMVLAICRVLRKSVTMVGWSRYGKLSKQLRGLGVKPVELEMWYRPESDLADIKMRYGGDAVKRVKNPHWYFHNHWVWVVKKKEAENSPDYDEGAFMPNEVLLRRSIDHAIRGENIVFSSQSTQEDDLALLARI